MDAVSSIDLVILTLLQVLGPNLGLCVVVLTLSAAVQRGLRTPGSPEQANPGRSPPASYTEF